MLKKILFLATAAMCLTYSGLASAAIVQTSTQLVFNDVDPDGAGTDTPSGVFDSEDYLNPFYTYTLSANKFDGSLGTLLSVVITLNGYMEGSIGFENISTNAQSLVNGSISSLIQLNASTGATLVTVLPEFEVTNVLLDVFDGTDDKAGDSGITVESTPVPVVATEVETYSDASTLSLFLGSGTIDLDVQALAGGSTNNFGGSVETSNEVFSAATMEIYYVYDDGVVSVPAPSMIALLGLALGIVGARCRKV